VPDATLVFPLVSGVIALLGAPLWIGMVPPNRVYGLRARGDEAVWYAVNRATGRDIVVLAGLAMLLALELPDMGIGGAAYSVLMSIALAAGAALVGLIGMARVRRL